MKDKIFLDTNILVYLFSEDDPEKRRGVCRILAEDKHITGINNINELARVLAQKLKQPSDRVSAAIKEVSSSLLVVPFRIETILSAVRIMSRYKYAYFDSLVIALALENNCEKLYTEDLHHGQVIDGVLTINNIFKTTE